MLGPSLWQTSDIAKHLGVTKRQVEHAMARENIQPIARTAKLRLYLKSQVAEAAAALTRTRSYAATPGYCGIDLSDLSASPGINHTSALGISLAAGCDESTAQAAIDAAGVRPTHTEQSGEQMYLDSDTAPIVAALKAK